MSGMFLDDEWRAAQNWSDEATLRAVIQRMIDGPRKHDEDPNGTAVDRLYQFVVTQHKTGFMAGRRSIQGKIVAALGLRGVQFG